MLQRGRRITASIAWVAGSLIAWGIVCNVFGHVVFICLGNERQVKLPAGIDTAFNWTAVAGIGLVPVVVAVLAMRSRLPWTGGRSLGLGGFPIDRSGMPGPTER